MRNTSQDLDLDGVPSWGWLILMLATAALIFICVFGIFGSDALNYIKSELQRRLSWGSNATGVQPPATTRSVNEVRREVWKMVKLSRYHELAAEVRGERSKQAGFAEKCPFCFESYKPHDELAILHKACNHYFHRACELCPPPTNPTHAHQRLTEGASNDTLIDAKARPHSCRP